MGCGCCRWAIQLITCRTSIPVMLRSATSHGTRGLVAEMTDGTSQANAQFHRNVGFYHDLVRANIERITKGLAAELENLPVMAVGVTRAGCARRRCWRTSVSPGPTGAMPA